MKKKSLFDQMVDPKSKPDAVGYRLFDPKIIAELIKSRKEIIP